MKLKYLWHRAIILSVDYFEEINLAREEDRKLGTYRDEIERFIYEICYQPI